VSYRRGNLPRTDLNGLVDALELELESISRALVPSTTVITRVIASSGSGGSSAVSQLQANQTVVTTAGTTIPVSPSITSYIVLYRCINSSGDGIGCDISNITAGSFKATPLENGTLHWTAIPI